MKMLDWDQCGTFTHKTVTQLWLKTWFGHTHNNQRVQTLTKRNQKSDWQQSESILCAPPPPPSPFFTRTWSWMKSSARNTLSNKSQLRNPPKPVNLTKNCTKHTF